MISIKSKITHPKTQLTPFDLTIAIWCLQTAITLKVPTDSANCLLPPAVLPTCSGNVYDYILHLLHSQHRQVEWSQEMGTVYFSLSKSIFGVQTGHVILCVLLTTFMPKIKWYYGSFVMAKLMTTVAKWQIWHLWNTSKDICSCIILSGSNFYILY